MQNNRIENAEEVIKLDALPGKMRDRALWAREQILKNPEKAEIDEFEKLAWVYSDIDGLWFSIAGNYSRTSPKVKMEKAIKYKQNEILYEKQARKLAVRRMAEHLYYSDVRNRILERDNWTCQICGQRIGRLEVHHIIKRKEVRVDTDDNLVTLCKKCHGKEDSANEYGKYKSI